MKVSYVTCCPTGVRTIPANLCPNRKVLIRPRRDNLRPEHFFGSQCSISHMATGKDGWKLFSSSKTKQEIKTILKIMRGRNWPQHKLSVIKHFTCGIQSINNFVNVRPINKMNLKATTACGFGFLFFLCW